MSQMGISVYGGPADIHPYKWRVDGFKNLLGPG